MQFYKSVYKHYQQRNLDILLTDIAKIIGRKWAALPLNQKQEFEQKFINDKMRHDKEIKELLSKGYFVNAEGVKSTDLPTKAKRVSTKSDVKNVKINRKRKAVSDLIELDETNIKQSQKRQKKIEV